MGCRLPEIQFTFSLSAEIWIGCRNTLSRKTGTADQMDDGRCQYCFAQFGYGVVQSEIERRYD